MTLILAWLFWAAIAVASFSNVLPSLIGLFVSAVTWLVLAIPTSTHLKPAVLIAASIATIVAGVAFVTDWDLALRIALSRSALNQVVDDAATVQVQYEACQIGLFNVRHVAHYEHATLFATQAVALEEYGIAFVSDGQPPIDASGMWRFWHINGKWFGYEWDG